MVFAGCAGELQGLVGKLIFIIFFMKFIASSLKCQCAPLGCAAMGFGLAQRLLEKYFCEKYHPQSTEMKINGSALVS